VNRLRNLYNLKIAYVNQNGNAGITKMLRTNPQKWPKYTAPEGLVSKEPLGSLKVTVPAKFCLGAPIRKIWVHQKAS